MYCVEFQPSGRRTRISRDATLLEAARRAGVALESICGGEGTCGKCRIAVLEGSTTSLDSEERYDSLPPGLCLACRTRATSDLKLYVPRTTATGAQNLQLSSAERAILPDSPVHKMCVAVDEPSLDDLRSDWSRLHDKYRTATGGSLSPDPFALRVLPNALREGDWRVTAVTYGGSEFISVDPGDTGGGEYGVAVDLGTTKVAAYLIDLESGRAVDSTGAMNPQIAFGEDVMARAAHVMSSSDGGESIQAAVVQLLNDMIEEMTARNSLTQAAVLDVTLVGNTAMHHILHRLPVNGLVRAPYVPAVAEAMNVKARELGLHTAPGAYVYTPPVVAGFVGPDHLAMLVAADLDSLAGNVIAVDVGTNTEISLITDDGHISTCSCASGPALEGRHIRFGMRAAPGAIEHVVADEGTGGLVVETVGGELATGICGSGVVEAVAALLKAGIIDRRGHLIEGTRGVRTSQSSGSREYVLVPAGLTAIDEDIVFTQDDIDAVMLAKGAIRAGMETLLAHASLGAEDISRVVVAGAFGAHIDPLSAIAIGLFPDVDVEFFVEIGNGAGCGARMMLLSREWRNVAVALAEDRIEYVELTTSRNFSRTFAHSLLLPGHP